MVNGKILAVDSRIAAWDTETIGEIGEWYVFDPSSDNLLSDCVRYEERFWVTLETGDDVRSTS